MSMLTMGGVGARACCWDSWTDDTDKSSRLPSELESSENAPYVAWSEIIGIYTPSICPVSSLEGALLLIAGRAPSEVVVMPDWQTALLLRAGRATSEVVVMSDWQTGLAFTTSCLDISANCINYTCSWLKWFFPGQSQWYMNGFHLTMHNTDIYSHNTVLTIIIYYNYSQCPAWKTYLQQLRRESDVRVRRGVARAHAV